jgi:hypothetical protein
MCVLSPQLRVFSGCEYGKNLRTWRVVENMLKEQSQTVEKWWSPSLREGLDSSLNTQLQKKKLYKMLCNLSDLVGLCEHGNEPPGSINSGEFLENLSVC